MDGMHACTVKYLLSARSAWSGDKHRNRFVALRHSFSYGRKQYHLAKGQRGLVRLFLIAKRTRHTAATAGYAVDGGAAQQREHLDGFLNAYKRFLMTMAVKPDFDRSIFEVVGRDIAFLHFAHEEFVEEQSIVSKLFGFLPHSYWHKVGIFVAEAQDARGFDAHEW